MACKERAGTRARARLWFDGGLTRERGRKSDMTSDYVLFMVKGTERGRGKGGACRNGLKKIIRARNMSKDVMNFSQGVMMLYKEEFYSEETGQD